MEKRPAETKSEPMYEPARLRSAVFALAEVILHTLFDHNEDREKSAAIKKKMRV
jgi:hypothetical protein